MNIAVIYYTISGHSLEAARKLASSLTRTGHRTELIRLELTGPAALSNETADLKTIPLLDGCDAFILCTPVRGGALPPPVARWIERVPSFNGKKAACLITHFFPQKWGAGQVMTQFKSAVEAKGAAFCGWQEARWFIFHPGRQLDKAVRDISVLFAG